MLKGVAIILIICSHCSSGWEWGRLLTPWGGIGVAIFLVVSGYGLNESYKRNGLDGFWRKRLSKVYIPYIFTVLLYALVKGWSLEQFAGACLLIRCPYWFVSYIIVYYIAFWCSMKCFAKYRYLAMLIFSIACILVCSELQAEQSFSFLAGILLSLNKDKILQFQGTKQFMSACLFLAIVGLSFLAIKQMPYVRTSSVPLAMNVIQCLIKLPLGLSIILFCSYCTNFRPNPLFLFSGKISYELYLVHFPFYGFVGERLWPAIPLILGSYIIAYLFYCANRLCYKRLKNV